MEDSSKNPEANELESLEGSSTVVESPTSTSNPQMSPVRELEDSQLPLASPDGTVTPPPKPPKQPGERLHGLNLYLLAFVLLVVIALVVASVVYFRNGSKTGTSKKLSSQSLSTESLKQLANSDVTVGDSKQVLTVQSNAIFDGSVLLRSDVEIAGKLIVGDKLSLTGIAVSGQSLFQDVKLSSDLAVSGNAAIQKRLSVQGGLSVNGGVSFNGGVTVGQLTVNSLQLNSNLNLTHHITAGGATPSRSSGGALGSGGTTSVSGSDTAGSVSINTGSSPSSGCFITVNFTQHFNSTPHVVITPIGSSAANLNYYVNRSTSSFSVCTTSTPSSHQSFGFDYIIFD